MGKSLDFSIFQWKKKFCNFVKYINLFPLQLNIIIGKSNEIKKVATVWSCLIANLKIIKKSENTNYFYSIIFN